MKLKNDPGRLRMALAGIVALAITTVGVSSVGAVSPEAQIDSLEIQAGVLNQQVRLLNGALGQFAPKPPADLGSSAPILVAQSSRDLASVNVRLGQLEEQIRVLTGQVEGLQFQMTQMQTFLERLQEDYEFRFEQLEGGGLGKTSAAPHSGSDRLTVGLPQTQTENTIDQPISLGGDIGIGATDLAAPDILIDPSAEGFTLGAGEQILGTLPAQGISVGDQPLDLNFDSGALVTSDDATAQYSAGYDAVVRGDYAFAEDQFRQFIALFPNHAQAPDATNWLGETLILRGANDEAAAVLLEGFQKYPSSTRAPDLLLKLGIALAAAGENDTACRTFGEVTRRYPNLSPSFKVRLDAEKAKTQC